MRKDYIPYWSDELQKTHDDLTRAREEAETHPSLENNNKLQECKARHLKTKLECKRRGWREKTASLNMEKETSKLWKLTRALNDEGNKGHKVTLEEEGKTLTGKAAANAFGRAYGKDSATNISLTQQKEARTEERERREGTAQEGMEHEITMAELKKAIKKLKKKKSPGPDGVTNEMLQHLGKSALEKLLDIFNLSWRQGQVPQCWKEARMIPILKKGKNKTNVQSYRPISLTSCVCKTMERIVNQRLQNYLESESIIVTEQAGFRQYRSTEDQTTHLSQVIEDAFQAQKVTLVTFIDLQKAFDKVWKEGLLVKLLRYGIRGNMYRWTKSYLYNRRARVLVDGHCSHKVLLRQGVPQGGVLSPTLFILFVNDLVPELPKGVHAALYADDLVLWCSEEYATTATHRMQLALEKVAGWTETWGVTINREKTTATLFTLSVKARPGRLTLGNAPIKFEDQQTYLGVTFDKRLTWKPHIMNAEGKARRKLNIMRKLAGSQWGANEKILKSVYQGTVRPHLEYGSSSWMTAAKTHQHALDKVQNQALRIITGAMKSTPVKKMEQVTSIAPLIKRREKKAMVQAIKYEFTQNHPMSARLARMSSGRLKRTSFALETRALQRTHKAELPELVQPAKSSPDTPPWKDGLENTTIETTVPYLTTKDEQSNVTKKTLTLAMLEERYPQEAWIRVFTDGSATDAVRNGGAGVYIQYPSGETHAEAKPTGLHCTNYRAEAEALTHAANTISSRTDQDTQVVFLTDALSVLQAVISSKLPQLQQALNKIKCLRSVLQWIPSHCGIEGNEQADKMAKRAGQEEQENNPVLPSEMKTIIKSLDRMPQQYDSYHLLSRSQQVVIFRLRTGHNRLNQHLFKKMRIAPSPMCPCGEAEQDAAHILQECGSHHLLREEMWPTQEPLYNKLYGPVDALQRTAEFISRTGLQV